MPLGFSCGIFSIADFISDVSLDSELASEGDSNISTSLIF